MGPNTNVKTQNTNVFSLPTDMMTQRRAGLGFCERLVTRRDPPFFQCASTRCVSPSYEWPMRLMMTMMSVLTTDSGPKIALGTESWIWFLRMKKVLWKIVLSFVWQQGETDTCQVWVSVKVKYFSQMCFFLLFIKIVFFLLFIPYMFFKSCVFY